MSTAPNPLDQADDLQMPNELDMLKNRARMLGLEFSNNIGLETLRQRIADHVSAAEPTREESLDDGAPQVNPLEDAPAAPAEKEQTPRQKMLAEQMRLIRIRVTNMDPKKKDLHGEVLTVANRFIGTVRKFVPFGAATENGYHVPFCIYNMLKDREFLHVRSFTDPNTRQLRQETKYLKEFAIEVLDPLTPAELRRLAISQTSAGGNDPA